MKNYSPLLFLAGIFLITFFSCKKINESTQLGDGLIPPVDNVTTFDTSLVAITSNIDAVDSIRLTNPDYAAAGDLNDLNEFGKVHASFQFGIAPSSQPGTYPYYHKDSVLIDSVVLSLAYVPGSAFGDATVGSQTFHVFEIAQSSGFKWDSSYRYDDATSDYATTGPELGSKTFQVSKLADSISIPRKGEDTTLRVANVVRILLDNSLGVRLKNYDTTSGPNGGYNNDTTFRKLFKGFAIKVDQSGNVLTYFDLAKSKTKLTVYYRVDHLGPKDDTLSYDYNQTVLRSGFSIPQGKTNFVNITAGGPWLASTQNSAPDDKIYLQGAPSGSYTSIVIPALSTMGNKVIHRAELIATQIPSSQDNIFTPPNRIYLDRFRRGSADTSIIFPKDVLVAADGSLSLQSFGGAYKNNGYVFNITRYVQGIVTRHERNDTLRLYAPFEAQSFIPGFGLVAIPVAGVIYNGRVVLAGGNYPDPKTRLRLRIIYSNL